MDEDIRKQILLDRMATVLVNLRHYLLSSNSPIIDKGKLVNMFTQAVDECIEDYEKGNEVKRFPLYPYVKDDER